jgi:hypothetical protein
MRRAFSASRRSRSGVVARGSPERAAAAAASSSRATIRSEWFAGALPLVASRIALSTVGVGTRRREACVSSGAKRRWLPKRKSSSSRSSSARRPRRKSAAPAFIHPAGVMTQNRPPGATFSAASSRK